MKSILWLGLLAATTVSAREVAAAPQTPSAVTYSGCLSIDPTACGTFFFRKMLGGGESPTFWTFAPPAVIYGTSGRTYFLFEEFRFWNSAGSCGGRTIAYYFMPGACVIERRYDMTYQTDVSYFDPQAGWQTSTLQFAATAPEPGSMLLLGSALATLAAGRRARRRRNAPPGRSDR